MKKTLMLFAAFMLAHATSHAQTEKGSQTVGLNLGFEHSSSNGTAIDPDNSSANEVTKSFNIGPQYSYFVSNDLAVGASLTYVSNSYAYPPNSVVYLNSQSQKYYGGGIFLRKYFMYKDKIGLRVGPMIDYTHSKSTLYYSETNSSESENIKGNTWNFSLSAELVCYPIKHLGFSAMLANAGYSHYSATPGVSKTNYTYLNFINSGLSLSVFYSFGGK